MYYNFLRFILFLKNTFCTKKVKFVVQCLYQNWHDFDHFVITVSYSRLWGLSPMSNYDVCCLWRLLPYEVCHLMRFVAYLYVCHLRNLSHYDICRWWHLSLGLSQYLINACQIILYIKHTFTIFKHSLTFKSFFQGRWKVTLFWLKKEKKLVITFFFLLDDPHIL